MRSCARQNEDGGTNLGHFYSLGTKNMTFLIRENSKIIPEFYRKSNFIHLFLIRENSYLIPKFYKNSRFAFVVYTMTITYIVLKLGLALPNLPFIRTTPFVIFVCGIGLGIWNKL